MTNQNNRERLFATPEDGAADATPIGSTGAAARAQLRAELDLAAELGPEPLAPERREKIRLRLNQQLSAGVQEQRPLLSRRWPVLVVAASFGVTMIGLISLLLIQTTQPTASRGWLAPQAGVETYVAVDGSQLALTVTPAGPRLRLDHGRVVVRYQRKPGARPLIVETPLSTMVVRGTVFSVNVDPNQTKLTVRDGLVEARDTRHGRWRVGAGRQLAISAEGTSRVRSGAFTPLMREIDAHCAPTATASASSAETKTRPGNLSTEFASGALRVTKRGMAKAEKWLTLPLEHTDVQIQVSGFVARAQVTQKYGNPFKEPVEAIYVFPLPENAAVDSMTMKIGDRTIRSEIKRRDEARKLYEKAKAAGKRTALLEQERPNVFTQAVANIMPGDEIEIIITYVDLLSYRDQAYELVFPMVVGPRYTPGTPTGRSGEGFASDTNRVPDGSRTTAQVLEPHQRSAHDIAVAVTIDAGMELQNLYSPSHALDVWTEAPERRRVRLSPADTLPNKDFVLRYETAGDDPEMAVIPHHDERGGFFTLMIQPQREVLDSQTVPRELIFIIDTSGSMRGFPLDKSKQAMRRLLAGMRSSDRFNIVRFAGSTGTLWDSPQPHSVANVQAALAFVDGLKGSGGTEMAEGITRALSQPGAEGYLRIAFLLTDGFVDESEVMTSIHQERRSARVFTLGVGSSPNRNLLDRAAIHGRGEAFYVRQDENSDQVIARFFKRVDRPALTNIEIEWGELDVHDILPERLPDLFAGQPLLVHGRFIQGGESEVKVRGQLGSDSYEQEVDVELPLDASEHEALASIWARRKIKGLGLRMVAEPKNKAALVEEITATGLEYRLMTKWTSFVAVEERVTNVGGMTKKVVVPVELPEGVDYEGVFGQDAKLKKIKSAGATTPSSGFRVNGLIGKLPNSGLSIGGGGGALHSRGGSALLRGGSSSASSIGSVGGSFKDSRPVGGMVTKVPKAMRSTGQGRISRDQIQKVIHKNMGAIQRCYERELLKNPSLGGKLVIEWVINANGSVRTVRLKSSTLGSTAAVNCILAKIKRWQFPAPSGGEVTVIYPFIFKTVDG